VTPFDLLKKALFLYMRMCIHKRLESGGVASDEEAWFNEEVRGVLRWCGKVVLPALSHAARYVCG